MDKTKSLYAIYKFDFHKAKEPTIEAISDGVDGEKNVKIAQACFASLFDLNSVDNLVKFNKKGEPTRLPNDVLAKAGDNYEKKEFESNPFCNVLIDNRPGYCLIAIEKSTAWGSNPDVLRDMLLDNFNRMLADKFDLEMRIEARMNPKDIWEFVHERLYEHYRALADMFLEAARGLISHETEANPMAADALLKGVRLGLLDEEKYLPIALKMKEAACGEGKKP